MTITEQGCHRLCSVIPVDVMGVMPPEMCSVLAFMEDTHAHLLDKRRSQLCCYMAGFMQFGKRFQLTASYLDSESTVPKITGLEVKMTYHTTVAFTFLACLPLKRILEKFVSPCIIVW